jgi:hypothetical protein
VNSKPPCETKPRRTLGAADLQQPLRRIVVSSGILAVLTLMLPLTLRPSGADAAPLAGVVSGQVFRDLDADGVRDARELGEPGLTVVATCVLDNGPDNTRGTSDDVYAASPASAVTTFDGSWQIAVPGGPCRVSVTVPASKGFLRSTARAEGEDSPSDRFVDVGATGVQLSVSNPASFCQQSPTVVATCFSIGQRTDATVGPMTSMYGVKYLSSGLSKSDLQTFATANDIGSVYGLAHHRRSNTIFSSAYVKRGSDVGPGGVGAIYATDLATNTTRIFSTLGAELVGSDPHPTTNTPTNGGCNFRSGYSFAPLWGPGSCWLDDRYSIDLTGTIGIGDIDLSEDGSKLYAIAMKARTVEILSIQNGLGASSPSLGVGGQRSIAIPRPTNCPASVGEFRPMGMGVSDNDVFVGVVCDAAISQAPTDLRATVYRLDATTLTFDASPIADVPLGNVTRGHVWAFSPTVDTDQWHPWTSSPHFITHPIPSLSFLDLYRYPTPLLSDIVVDGHDLVLGFRDRALTKLDLAPGSRIFGPALQCLPVTSSVFALRARPTRSSRVDSAMAREAVRTARALVVASTTGVTSYLRSISRLPTARSP